MGAPVDGRRFVELGSRRYDVTTVPVMGIVNRTPDSFYDHGATFELDRALARADQLVADGADIIDVGGVKAGPGDAVTVAEELDRVVPAVEGIAARLDVAISVDTWRAEVADAAFGAGAVLGNDISGFADPAYLPAAARHGASVVATHIRLRPPSTTRIRATPATTSSARSSSSWPTGSRWRSWRGSRPHGSSMTSGSTSARRRRSRWSCSVPRPASPRWGRLFCCRPRTRDSSATCSTCPSTGARTASLAAVAYGVARGCRVVRVHDAARARRAADVLTAVLAA